MPEIKDFPVKGANESSDLLLLQEASGAYRSLASGNLVVVAPPPASVFSKFRFWYNLNETSGTRFDSIGTNDISPNAATQYSIAIPTPNGKRLIGCDFTGANYLTVAHNANQNFLDTLSIVAGFRLRTVSGNYTIVSKWAANNAAYWLWTSDNKLNFYCSLNGTSSTFVQSIENLSANTNYFVHAEKSGTTIRLSVNGGNYAIVGLTGNLFSSFTNFSIGTFNVVGNTMNGSIWNVGLSPQSLSISDIAALYNSGNFLRHPNIFV